MPEQKANLPRIEVENRIGRYFDKHEPPYHTFVPDGIKLLIFDVIKDHYGVALSSAQLKKLTDIYRDQGLSYKQTETKLAKEFPEFPNLSQLIQNYMYKVVGENKADQN